MNRNRFRLLAIFGLTLALAACGVDPVSGDTGRSSAAAGQGKNVADGSGDAKTRGATADKAERSDVDPQNACDGASADPGSDGSETDAIAEPASVEQDLQFLREEEKLARDVYLSLYEQWELPVLGNIARSEQRHMDAVKVRLDALGISDPVVDDSVGAFANEELARLYTDLVAKGLPSAVDALQVGATIEDLDIRDIEEMKQRTDDETVLQTYDSLVCGSGNHLRAFVGLLEAEGLTYEAQFSAQADLDAILAEPRERCGRR